MGSEEDVPKNPSQLLKVKVPKKFKTPDFFKYYSTTCPEVHLQYYLIKMTRYAENVPHDSNISRNPRWACSTVVHHEED